VKTLPQTRLHSLWLALLTCTSPLLALLGTAAEPQHAKPVLLYSRHLNAVGESRYLPDGSYKSILSRLASDFDVRVDTNAYTEKNLTGINVLLIANPSESAVGSNPAPHHLNDSDITQLRRFVTRGGGLIIMGNQENHNLEIAQISRLTQHFGLQFTNLYTDVKRLALPPQTPLIGGLRWGYYTGNLVLITEGHPHNPRSLVSNDLAVKPLSGTRNTPGSLLAISEPGKGRVALATDSGWISNDALSDKGIGGVSVNGQDNAEIFRRLALWTAGKPTVP